MIEASALSYYFGAGFRAGVRLDVGGRTGSSDADKASGQVSK